MNTLSTNYVSLALGIIIPAVFIIFILIGIFAGVKKMTSSFLRILISSTLALAFCTSLWKFIDSNTSLGETLKEKVTEILARFIDFEPLNNLTVGQLFTTEVTSLETAKIKLMEVFLNSFNKTEYYGYYALPLFISEMLYFVGSAGCYVAIFVLSEILLIILTIIIRSARRKDDDEKDDKKKKHLIIGAVFGLFEALTVIANILFILNIFLPSLSSKLVSNGATTLLYKLIEINPLRLLYGKFLDLQYIVNRSISAEIFKPITYVINFFIK